MEVDKIIAALHPLERKVLPILRETSSFEKIAELTKLQKVEVMRALQWLQNKKIISVKQKLQEKIDLDENGLKYRDKGLPEKTFLQLSNKPITLDEIGKRSNLSKQELSISLGILKSKGAIEIKKERGILISITNAGKNILNKGFPEEDFLKKKFPIGIFELNNEEKRIFESLKKRKNIVKLNIIKIINAELTEIGKKLTAQKIDSKNIIDRLTPSIIQSGEWKNKKLRSYDVAINVPNISGGKRHFVSQAIQYSKRIWLDMGFKEMTGPIVESSFWVFDALFTAQDHPVREMQDTFFIKNQKYGKLPEKKLVNAVKSAHENGGSTGSKGWQYNWKNEEAMKNVLRTHTTNLSARTLAGLKKSEIPSKFFAVGRCFRNEAIDWSHLFEFNQTEGIVIDPNANFRHLLGYLKEFFRRMGFEKARFRPAYFAYTEPSVEIDAFYPVHKKWIELGGAGILRPEVTKALLGEEIPVLAWGPGFDRVMMDYYDINDMRDIYKNDLKQLREMEYWMK
ncbi:phenylalanine--tRNA ligase subunit alpha [archaeon]|jgi:phenylalanyl-tRNA synthetase alpha chain|nr:phenylalanine--tRNA ligase subunit alpha [archaeon]MDP6548242.1 phenylalanine--tRNA ligase subunit alpha [Candidatus Woesearchaeota archaeon]|tara:strand:- start:26937 stop:28469 length:1533 start_codon:yes stop_codon:yes gene_type:complete